MRRRLFDIVAVVSLLLCVATIAVWISTYYWSIHYAGSVIHEEADGFHPFFKYVATNRGEITFACVWNYQHLHDGVATPQEVEAFRRYETINRPSIQRLSAWDYEAQPESQLSLAGFEFWLTPVVKGAITATGIGIRFPLWFVTTMFAVVPAWRPVGRIIRAVRAAPPLLTTRRQRLRSRLITMIAVIAVGLFVLTQFNLYQTRTLGASFQFGLPGSTIVDIAAQRRIFSITWITHWPQPRRLTFVRKTDEFRPIYPYWEGGNYPSFRGFLGIEWTSSGMIFHVERDGSICLLPYGSDYNYWMVSQPLPFRQVRVSLFEIGLLIIALPTAILLVRVRRRVRRYHAIKECRCLQCGYSLAGNTSGVCPECGTSIAPVCAVESSSKMFV